MTSAVTTSSSTTGSLRTTPTWGKPGLTNTPSPFLDPGAEAVFDGHLGSRVIRAKRITHTV
jgi:hypothetical protein